VTVDLHLHSLVSDGTATPEDVVRRCAEVGLKTIAIADHDDAASVAPARAAGAKHGVRIIAAVEMTARVDGRPDGSVHVVGLGVNPEDPVLLEASRKNRLGKRDQILGMLDALRKLGIPIDPEEVGLRPGEDSYVGRNRIASILVQRGLCKDRLKAFKKYLNPKARGWVPAEVVSGEDAVRAIRAAGGIAVLAHPTEEDLERRLGKLCDAGVEAIEVWRPKAQGTLLEKIERARERRGLLASGGSDWHGLYPGVPLGDWKVSEEQVRPLLERLAL
jgi:predicted metal-dependent phosphoesterase TrpH